MEDNSEPSFFENYSQFQFLVRKNKKKKRKRVKPLTNDENVSNSSEQLDSTEPRGGSATEDNVSDAAEADTEADEVIIENLVKPQSANIGCVSTFEGEVVKDAFAYTRPSYSRQESECFQEDTNLIDEALDESNVKLGETELLNTNPLLKEATTYELEKFKKNALLIFNHKEIDGHEPRYGTEKDVESLTKTFENFGFEVTLRQDLTKDQLFKELETFTDRNFTDYGCVAVAVLTHGSKNGLLRAKDQQYSEIEIINHFKVVKNPTLVTKPRIIIIQACRGKKTTPGTAVFQSGKVRKDIDDEVEPYILPVEADMLILHSSYMGSPSLRNELYGGWFIQTLCKEIDTLASSEDLESILTVVKREVAINKHHVEYNMSTLQLDVNKQMPVVTSTLIRKLYLKKYGEQSVSETTYADAKRESISSCSRNEVQGITVPSTPLLVQFGPCSCFLDYFNYIKSCLKSFTEDNPNDKTAKSLLEIANTFDEGVEFNEAKSTMCKAICQHLQENARLYQHFKYLYFYKHGS